jgi:hypothetical protein
MRSPPPHARVRLETRRLWTLRASLGATRWVMYAVALVGVIATARNVISPPRERVALTAAPRTSDASAEWFALSFARAYLTWSAASMLHQTELSPFLAANADPDAGLRTAVGSSQKVQWLKIADERDRPDGERDYTVAAGTGGGSIRYVVVAVARGADGREVLVRYPALVGAPVPRRASALDRGGLPLVTNAAVIAVLDRALRNYVDASSQNLAADLAPGANVTPIAPGLSLRGVLRLAAEPASAVLATVSVEDAGGDVFTLAYELSLALLGGRWEITQVQS